MKRKALFLMVMVLLFPSVLVVSKGIERLKVTLQHRAVKSVAPRLMEELTSGGQIGMDTKRNTLTVVDEEAVVEKIRNMLAELDVPPRRFAISASLSIFSAPQESIFRKDEKLTDIADFMNMSKPAEKYEGIADITEGKGGRIDFKSSPYTMSIDLGGYDPWERKLGFENISLEKKSDKGSVIIFKARANLKEGIESSIAVPGRESFPPLKMAINPTILPQIKTQKETP